jgi:ribose 5-phosphate isomerase A
VASDRAHTRGEPSPLSTAVEQHKRAAARAAAELVEDGMRLGLGTGSTVAHLLPALAERKLTGVRCVATSPATERAALALGLNVLGPDQLPELDLAIDGADQIDPAGWLIKGGGGAHTREKILAAAASTFVVIASAEKAVERLTPPVPLELLRFGVRSTMHGVGTVRLRAASAAVANAKAGIDDKAGIDTQSGIDGATGIDDESAIDDELRAALVSPDGGLIADFHGEIGDPAALAAHLSATPGVVEHGLFAPEMVALMLLAGDDGVERRVGSAPVS